MNTVLIAVVIVMIIAVSTLVITTNIGAAVQRTLDMYTLGNAKQAMSALNNAVNELAFEVSGKRTIVEKQLDGYLIVSGKTDTIKFLTKPTSVFEPGTQRYENGMLVTSGPPSLAYEKDVDSDGVDELVLENDAIIFAVEKLGSETNFVSIDAQSLISLIKIKGKNIGASPKLKIEIDGVDKSEGKGYTMLVAHQMAVSNSIVLHVDGKYDAVFSLGGGQDFVSLRVNVV